MINCLQNQNSYDIAEDQFLEYDVFVCVDRIYKKRIKIQLFKIIDNNKIFYEGHNESNHYYTFYERGYDS